MNKIDLIIDALECAYAVEDMDVILKARAAARELQAEKQEPEQEPVNTMPTKIVGPNLEQILNSAGFYKREWVGLTDAELAEFSNMKLGAYDLCLEVEAKLKEKNGG
jgi:galactose-1-phosphate uridylyltransferase